MTPQARSRLGQTKTPRRQRIDQRKRRENRRQKLKRQGYAIIDSPYLSGLLRAQLPVDCRRMGPGVRGTPDCLWVRSPVRGVGMNRLIQIAFEETRFCLEAQGSAYTTTTGLCASPMFHDVVLRLLKMDAAAIRALRTLHALDRVGGPSGFLFGQVRYEMRPIAGVRASRGEKLGWSVGGSFYVAHPQPADLLR